MPTVRRFVIGLGSNLGDRLAQLERGAFCLAELGSVLARSPVYESVAWGGPDQGPFLNAAALVAAALTPQELLRALLEIEKKLGRERRERWGPRTLDLDILWGNGSVVREPGLRIPHERLTERTFALRPLLDVMPEAMPQAGDDAYAVVLERLQTPLLRRVVDASEWAKGVEISGGPPHHALR